MKYTKNEDSSYTLTLIFFILFFLNQRIGAGAPHAPWLIRHCPKYVTLNEWLERPFYVKFSLLRWWIF